MECHINVKLNKSSSKVITQIKWMFNKDKYPNNMKKFIIIPKWNMCTVKIWWIKYPKIKKKLLSLHEYPNVYTQIYYGYDG